MYSLLPHRNSNLIHAVQTRVYEQEDAGVLRFLYLVFLYYLEKYFNEKYKNVSL